MFRKKIIVRCFVFQAVVTGFSISTDLLADDRSIWEAGTNEFIKYAEQDSSDFGENDHPVSLSVDEISKALGSLAIPKRRGSEDQEQQPVFTVEQVNVLSQNLAKGLANALPNQDIHFALQKSVKRRFGLKPRRFYVAGKAFHKNQRLNIIIGEYDRPADDGFEAAYDPTHVGIVSYHFDQGRRAESSNAIKAPIAAIQGIENKMLSDRTRTDWFVIDLKSASVVSSDLKTAIREREEQATKQKEPDEIPGGSGAIGAQPAALEPSAAKDPASAKESTLAVTEEPVPVRSSLEERLKTLNRLRDQGLITEAEYAAKRKQMLDEL